jgi:hypothetical protein
MVHPSPASRPISRPTWAFTWVFTWAAALMVATLMVTTGAGAADGPAWPDWSGQWIRIPVKLPTQPSHDQTKPWGRGQEAPLTPEYQKILEDSIADQAAGGLGNFPTTGRAAGMPHMMMGFGPMEMVVTPEATFVLIGWYDHYRRIYTDGRDFPAEIEPTFGGYSIGKWVDTDGDGVYDTLDVETRGPFKGPRAYDEAGLPLHVDNQSVFKERFWRDKTDPNILHDEITTIDHALTRPWTVMKNYRRNPNGRPVWNEAECEEGQGWVRIGNEAYYLSAEGLLMPAKKGQAAPDLRYFKQR